MVPNDTEVREYSYPVGLEDGWRGRIGKLRLELLCGAAPAGEILVGGLQVTDPRVLKTWDFTQGTDSWSAVRGVRGMERRDGR